MIRIDGLDRTRTDVLVQFDFADGVGETRRLTPGDSSFTVPTVPSRLEVVRTYLLLGFKHILSGADHLLFVFALLMLVKGLRRVIITVTAFTLAHSLTLAAATLGFVQVPAPPIEAVIALSIAFVASEIIHDRRGKPGLTTQYPWLVAFTFGLLHGFGFAGALAQIGLPQNSIPTALLFFNVGVEIGQICFILGIAALGWLVHFGWSRKRGGLAITTIQTRLSTPAAYVVGSLAAFWFIDRLQDFVPV